VWDSSTEYTFGMADDDVPRSETTEPTMVGDVRFYNILSELAEEHTRSAELYGIHDAESAGFFDDPLSNTRYASPDFGIEPWVYSLMRANDHMRRLQAIVISDAPGNDNPRDSFIKLASYAITALVFFEEDSECLTAFSNEDDAEGE
jgi:hypothetical protein